jgi:hypothetical protein
MNEVERLTGEEGGTERGKIGGREGGRAGLVSALSRRFHRDSNYGLLESITPMTITEPLYRFWLRVLVILVLA